jgi:uncharacterized protein
MRIVISGKTGFIGSKITTWFLSRGYEVTAIGRSDFAKGSNHLSGLISGSDFVINLAGAPIIKRWTKSYSKKLWDSRIVTTHLLTDAIGTSNPKPRAFFSASVIGIYAEEGIQTEEQNRYDDDFLGILCQRWEEEALKARILCPVYIMRIGIVLGREGGALPKMALPFKMFVGGKIGSGRQITSWIHIDDFIGALNHIMERLPEESVFNFTAPNPVSNAEFSSVLARTLERPNFFSVPSFALRFLYGDGAVALLNGQHVLPERLLNDGFTFTYPKLDSALHNLLGKNED